ncbi:hypothetical protein JCM3774_005181 [Rhodotorula dairenensis]
MVNVTHTPEGNLLTYIDGEPVIYNLGVAAATVVVHIMPIGLGLLYSGLLRRKNALSMLFLSMCTYAVGAVQWFLMGYSLTYSETGSSFIGNFKYGGGRGVDIQPSPGSTAVPALLYFVYQLQFQAITAVILIAGTAERGRVLPFLILAFAWCTVVYNPVACWVWSANGWLYNHYDLDFAGGGPVHIASGVGSFVLSYFVGPRRGYGTAKLDYRPQSPFFIVLGTALIWAGWLGFNGASMSAFNLKSAMCLLNTVLAGSMGALSWTALDYLWTGKYSAIGVSSGILAGLIGITPAVGYVGAPAALAVGALTAAAANLSTGLKHLLKVDDAVDAGALHAIGGVCGAILTGIFADSRVASFDGMTEIEGGWINGNFKQMGWQLAGALTIVAYTAIVTYLLCVIINFIPGCKFRSSEEAEVVGIDEEEIGEFTFDYVLLDQEYQPRQRTPQDAKLATAARLSTVKEEETRSPPSEHSDKEGVSESEVTEVTRH